MLKKKTNSLLFSAVIAQLPPLKIGLVSPSTSRSELENVLSWVGFPSAMLVSPAKKIKNTTYSGRVTRSTSRHTSPELP